MGPFEGKAPGLEGIRARDPQRAVAVPAGNLVHHRITGYNNFSLLTFCIKIL